MNSGRTVIVVILVVVGGFLLLGVLGSLFAVRAVQSERAHVVAAEQAHAARASRQAQAQLEQTVALEERLRQNPSTQDRTAQALANADGTSVNALVSQMNRVPGLVGFRVLRDPMSGGTVVIDESGDWILFAPEPLACGLGAPTPRPLEGGRWEVAHGEGDRIRLDPEAGAPPVLIEKDEEKDRMKTSAARFREDITSSTILDHSGVRAVLEGIAEPGLSEQGLTEGDAEPPTNTVVEDG